MISKMQVDPEIDDVDKMGDIMPVKPTDVWVTGCLFDMIRSGLHSLKMCQKICLITWIFLWKWKVLFLEIKLFKNNYTLVNKKNKAWVKKSSFFTNKKIINTE